METSIFPEQKVSKCYCVLKRFRPVDDQWGNYLFQFFPEPRSANFVAFLNVSDRHINSFCAAQRSKIRFLWPRSEARFDFNCRAAKPDRNFRREKILREFFLRFLRFFTYYEDFSAPSAPKFSRERERGF